MVKLSRRRIRNLRRLKNRLQQGRPPFGGNDGEDDDPEAEEIINQLLLEVFHIELLLYTSAASDNHFGSTYRRLCNGVCGNTFIMEVL